MGAVTILQAVGGARLTKRVTDRGVEPYDNGTWFAVEELPASRLLNLAALLANLERDPSRCVIRGRPLPGTNRNRCRRLLYPTVDNAGREWPATFETASRRWLALDFDSLPTPQWNEEDLARRREAIARDRLEHPPHPSRPKGADDGEDYDFDADGDPAPIDPVRDWTLVIRAAVSLLPTQFHGTSAWWQMTSSAGIKPGVRLRLWYWLGREISDDEAKRWLRESPTDLALFNPVQVHYTAAPIFDPPSLDPVPLRSGWWWRHVNEVSVPELPEPPRPEPVAPEYSVGEISPVAAEDHRELARQCLVRSDLTAWERDFCAKAARLETLTPKQLETLTTIADRDPMPARAAAYADKVLSRHAAPGNHALPACRKRPHRAGRWKRSAETGPNAGVTT
jgi:hypothetical protein